MKTSENLKERTFYVPKGLLGNFFSRLEEAELEFDLIDLDPDEDELEISLSYSQQQRGDVLDLIELIDDYEASEDEEDDK